MEPDRQQTNPFAFASSLEQCDPMNAIEITKHRRAQKIFAGVFLVLIFFSLVGAWSSPVFSALQKGQTIPVLMFGVDAADKSRHTDTLMVAVLDPLANRLSLLSIPRDTRIRLPGYLFNRVNEIFGYHLRKKKSPQESAQRVKEGVEYLLSPEDRPIKIPSYLNVDFSGFVNMVDLLGGVWVDVETPMNYDDNAGNLHIHFEPGHYLVNGADALRYVRFRGQTGDKGRIFRQQEFLRNMAKRLANPTVVFKLPRMMEAVYASVDTNLSFWDFLYLANAVRRIRYPDLGFFILPGQPRGPFWQVKRNVADHLIERIFWRKISEEGFLQPIAALEGQITVNVWNASGKKGIAYQISTYLRRRGFDVMEWGTYAAQQIPTRVIDRTGQIKNAQGVANALGVHSVHSEANPNALVDVEVVIGRDYQLPPDMNP
jgi:LCP family protein required for cell wall assembly